MRSSRKQRMCGSASAARRMTSAVPSVEALSIRIASQLRVVFIATSESSVPRSCPARLRVQMTIDKSGSAELMYQSCQIVHRTDKPSGLRAPGPGIMERGDLAVHRIKQQMPDAQQAAQDVRMQPIGDHHRSLAQQAEPEGQPLTRIMLAQTKGE